MKSYEDLFSIEIRASINSYDLTAFRMFYSPFISREAMILYSAIYDQSKLGANDMKKMKVHKLMNFTNFDLNEINDARETLESFGLLQTFFKKGSPDSYILTLIPPLSPREFHRNPILSRKLKNSIGDIEYENLLLQFSVVEMPKENFMEISSKYNAVAESKKSNLNLDDLSKLSLANAVTELRPNQFAFYLTKKPCSGIVLQTMKEMQTWFSNEAINLIINYTVERNNGSLVINYAKKIAEDLYFKRSIKSALAVRQYLNDILERKKISKKQTYRENVVVEHRTPSIEFTDEILKPSIDSSRSLDFDFIEESSTKFKADEDLNDLALLLTDLRNFD